MTRIDCFLLALAAAVAGVVLALVGLAQDSPANLLAIPFVAAAWLLIFLGYRRPR